MTDPSSWIDRTRRGTEVTVAPVWRARIVARVRRRTAGRRLFWVAMAATTCAAGVVILIWQMRPDSGLILPTAPQQPIRFDEAASGEVSRTGEALVTERSPSRTRVLVRRGAVHFDVRHAEREFRVEAGPVTVIVLGTKFTVDRQPEGVHVSVERGRVRVEAPTERVDLAQGEARFFAEISAATAPAPRAETAPEEADPPRALAVPRPGRDRWQALARKRRAQPRDDVEQILLAADAARYSSHWAEALDHYDRVLARYPDDARAGSVAFTKARLLLYRLGRPADAAAAFQVARTLPLQEGLRQDALLHEVAAWSRAGDEGRARERARDYLRLYPGGPAAARLRASLGDP